MNTTTDSTMATRHIGFCPACEGEFKVRDGVLVHHGYQRPGCGFIVGDCFAVHLPPHETSPATATKFLEHLKGLEAFAVKELERLRTTDTLRVEKTVLRYENGRHVSTETVLLKKAETPEREWMLLRAGQVSQQESVVSQIRTDIARVTKLVNTWVQKPLRTVEEDVAQKKAIVETRRLEKSAERSVKVQAKIEGYQKRIDSAVRRKNASSLANIWEKVNGNLAYELKISKEEVFARIDRDSVWKLFGLQPGGNWREPDAIEKSNRAILQKMHGYFEKTPFWP